MANQPPSAAVATLSDKNGAGKAAAIGRPKSIQTFSRSPSSLNSWNPGAAGYVASEGWTGTRIGGCGGATGLLSAETSGAISVVLP